MAELFFKQSKWRGMGLVKSILLWLLGSGLVLGLIFGFIMMALSHITVLESFLTLMPQRAIDGKAVLAFGIDETSDVKRSDSIMVLYLSSDGERIGVISIPRDTRVKVDGLGFTKINHAYAFGGTPKLVKTVSQFLGVPIDYYVQVDLKGVAGLVDLIGGVQVTVDKDLYYRDYAGDLHIDLSRGEQLLTGDQAVQYLRFRQDGEGDIGRIRRQQTFVQKLAESLTSSKRLLSLPVLVKEAFSVIDTNLSVTQMGSLAVQFLGVFQDGRLNKDTVPGAVVLMDGVSYWRPDITKLDALVQDMMFGLEEKVTWSVSSDQEGPEPDAMVGVRSPDIERLDSPERIETLDQFDLLAQSGPEPVLVDEAQVEIMAPAPIQNESRSVTMKEMARISDQTERVRQPEMEIQVLSESLSGMRLELLNGMGTSGIAHQAQRFLEAQGFNVVKVGNAGHFGYQESVLVDWKGNLDQTVQVADFLLIDPSTIIVYDKPQKPLEMSLVLGHDWLQLKGQLERRQNGQ